MNYTYGVLLLILIYIPSSNYANPDSLNTTTNTNLQSFDSCEKLYAEFERLKTLKDFDALQVLATTSLDLCDFNIKQGLYPNLSLIAVSFYEFGLIEFADSFVESIAANFDSPSDSLLLYTQIANKLYLTEYDEKSDFYIAKAKELLPFVNDDSSRCYYYSFWALYNMTRRNTFSALQSFRLASTFKEADSIYIITNNMYLGLLYIDIGENLKALELLNRNLELTKNDSSSTHSYYNYYSIMHAYSNMERYNDVIATCQKAIALDKKINMKSFGYTYYMYGSAHLELSNLDSAKYYFDKGIERSIADNGKKELQDNYSGIAFYYEKKGNIKKAIEYLEKASGKNSYYKFIKYDTRLADLWQKRNNIEKVNYYLNAYKDYNESRKKRTNEDYKLATQLFEESYSYKQKVERDLFEKEQRQSKLYFIILIIVVLSLFLSIVLFLVNKNRKKLSALNSIITKRNRALDISINNQNETIKYLENFAAFAAHDLKAPIRTASSFARLAQKKGKSFSEEELEYLGFINTSLSQLTSMIDDLLLLSKLGSNLPQEQLIDMNEVVVEVIRLLFDKISQTNTTIEIEDKLPIVNGHQTLFIQLFQNLIKNAIVHNKTANDSIIQISSEIDGDKWYVIKIRDNSGGIPEFIIPTLFDLFSSINKSSGNGIGLAICKKIVNYYGGEIWVEITENIGSTFHFKIPKVSARSELYFS